VTDTVESLDAALADVVDPDAQLRVIGEGYRFTEGPAWHTGQQALYFSDIPNDTIFRWTAGDAAPRVWRRPSRRANGNTVDRHGRLVTCEHGSRSVTRTDDRGNVTTLAATFQGRPLNSPNDVVVDAAGAIWFTDPPYGIKPERSEQRANFVFRLPDGADEPVAVVDHLPRPNGLCFSPDGKFLYVANSDVDEHNIWRFSVREDGTVAEGVRFAVIAPGVPDGMRVDRDGRLWSTAGDGVHIFSPDGQLLGKIHTPRTAANCTFGGPEGRTLFITATDTVWAIDVRVAGVL